MSNSEQAKTVVIDNGTSLTKAGFASDMSPRLVFPSLIGRPVKHVYIGNEAQAARANLELNYPIQRGTITNWDDMESIWFHTFYNELNIAPEEYSVLLTEVPFSNEKNREKMAEIILETFNMQSIYIAMQTPLALYSTSRVTGMVIESGDGLSQVVPVYEGFVLLDAIQKLELAGQDVTENLANLCRVKEYSIENETWKDMKEKLCSVALDFDYEINRKSEIETSYELPDGRVIKIGSEKFLAPELLFQPYLFGKSYLKGIHEQAFESLMKCDLNQRNILSQNIVLSGGSSMFTGMKHRFRKEFKRITHQVYRPKIIMPHEPKYSVWIGGSVLASVPCFKSMSITRDEFKESGRQVIFRKRFSFVNEIAKK